MRDVDVVRRLVGAQRGAHVRAQRHVAQQRTRGLGFGELGPHQQGLDLLHAGFHRQALGVEHQVEQHRVAPVDAELLVHAGGVGMVAAPDLGLRGLDVVGVEFLHQPLHALVEGPHDANARHMRHRTQQLGGAPAADDHVALGRGVEHLLGGVDGHARAVGAQALDRPGLARAQPADQALGHVHLAGHALGHLVLQRRQLELVGQLFGDVLRQRAHSLCQCDDRHEWLLCVSRSAVGPRVRRPWACGSWRSASKSAATAASPAPAW